MEVGTTPLRWQEMKRNDGERKKRANKTVIMAVESFNCDKPVRIPITTPQILDQYLKSTAISRSGTTEPSPQPRRIFIVEDLSRKVIEMLGDRFNIDPLCFREQLEDYVWYNVRDPWANMPNLTSNHNRRTWFTVRNVRLRYHHSEEEYYDSRLEANTWNVYRRPDDDQSSFRYADSSGTTISIQRTRSTFWIGEDPKHNGEVVAVVLLDPTVTRGLPLWYDRANWNPIPKEGEPIQDNPSRSLYHDIILKTIQYPWFSLSAVSQASDMRRITLPALYTICAEWLLVCEYVQARLSQIQWTLEMPAVFVDRSSTIDGSLKQLNVWRRTVPQWRSMVDETLEQGLPAAARLTHSKAHDPGEDYHGEIEADFKRVSKNLIELQARVDQLSDRMNAEMQLLASRQGLQESHNLARLTWLATIFVPLSFMTGLFSMTQDLSAIRETMKTYFKAAIPVAVGALLFARWGAPFMRSIARPIYSQWVEKPKIM